MANISPSIKNKPYNWLNLFTCKRPLQRLSKQQNTKYIWTKNLKFMLLDIGVW